jgi:TolB protein
MNLGLWIALGCVAAALLSATPAQATFPGQNGRIAYTDRAGDIWTIEPDGTGAANLTNSAAREDTPDWSPDGTKIAFATDADKTEPCNLQAYHAPLCNYELYTMNANGTGQTRLTNDSGAQHYPSFSPDGSKLAFSDFGGCYSDVDICVEYVGVLDLASRTSLPFETGLGNDLYGGYTETEPAWSPDGTKIAFVHPDEDFTWGIYVSNTDGSNPQLVEPGFAPDWSPDQSKLLLQTQEGRIVSVHPDGSGFEYLTDPPPDSGDFAPVWSPDGTKIAFTRYGTNPPATLGLYVANADGSSPVKIADGYVSSWQPLPGPRRTDYKNGAQFCKADRDFLGDSGFASKYGSSGNGADAFGKCVAGKG